MGAYVTGSQLVCFSTKACYGCSFAIQPVDSAITRTQAAVFIESGEVHNNLEKRNDNHESTEPRSKAPDEDPKA